MLASIGQTPSIPDAISIPYVKSSVEAEALLSTALERFVALVETLGTDDWGKPTACAAWTVRDILAHQAGGYASGIGYREMIRQYGTPPRKGQLPEDAINALQLRERAGHSTDQMIGELRRVGPIAIRKWASQFRMIKPLALPHPVGGLLTVRHLMWVIHSRDTWMHRVDICRATGRPIEQTREHDGRIVALIVRDVAARLRKQLDGRAVALELSGRAGGVWKLGVGDPAATLSMDALDFSIFASGRYGFDQARAKARMGGDVALAERVLRRTLILF
jgi:uncharacterized protein (TIGR03083 family)